MNARKVIIGLLSLLCAGAVIAVFIQRDKLAALRAGQTQSGVAPAEPTADAQQSSEMSSDAAASSGSAELLQLRSTVTRLEARKRELAGVAAENERLRAQFAVSRTNSSAAGDLPKGYIRKSQAQMVGYSTPENTIQSLLWAVNNHDLTNVLRAFSPACAQRLQGEIASRSPETFWQDADKLPGIGVLGSETLPDGAVQLHMAIAPGENGQKVRLQAINGEWKLDGPF